RDGRRRRRSATGHGEGGVARRRGRCLRRPCRRAPGGAPRARRADPRRGPVGARPGVDGTGAAGRARAPGGARWGARGAVVSSIEVGGGVAGLAVTLEELEDAAARLRTL